MKSTFLHENSCVNSLQVVHVSFTENPNSLVRCLKSPLIKTKSPKVKTQPSDCSVSMFSELGRSDLFSAESPHLQPLADQKLASATS